jgi:hypothetical protein
VPPQAREFTLPYFGDHAATDSRHALYYITRAVAGWRDPKVTVAPRTDASDLASTPLVIVAGPLGADDARRVREHVQAGAFALVLLADASVVPTAATLVDETGWAAAPTPAPNTLLGSINFQHPLFQPFADPRFSNFTRVRFWKPVPVVVPEDSKATVVARFDEGSAAVLEAEVGRGRVVVWGGDWSNVASQWVLSTKFIPWLQALAERAAGGPPRPNVAEVGETAALAPAAGATWSSAAGQPLDNAPASPGAYQLTEDGRSRIVALQVPAGESRTDPLPADTWEQLGVPVEARAVTAASAGDENLKKIAATDAVTESQQQYWRWLLIAAALLLAGESIAAIRAAQRQAAATGDGQAA